VTPGGRTLLKMPFIGTQSTSKGYWADSNRLVVASYGERQLPFTHQNGENDRLIWINLQANANISDEVLPVESGQRAAYRDARNQAILAAQGSAWGILAMDGETANAVMPDWSNDGTRIVYVSTNDSPNGHPSYEATQADLRIVPFNEGAGGPVSSLNGASDPNLFEYYPAFSADDQLIAFNRAPAKNASSCPGASCPDGPYYNRHAEIHVVSSEGGMPVRLAANDPVACAGDNLGDGLINSWPKWSPHATSVDGKTYYFLIFSSARLYPGSFVIPRGPYTPATLDTRSSQLYMAAIVVDDASGEITTYPAVYLWNQNRVVAAGTTEVQNSNLTPAWDDFVIPPVEIPR
jgi:hypothetical protein